MKMRFVVPTLMVAAGVLATSAFALSSGTDDTEITAHKGGEFGAFHGTIKSGVRACHDHRRVLLFDEDEDPAERVATTFSDSDGHWFVDAEDEYLSSGDYYAKVRVKDIHRPGLFVRCQPDRSPAVRYSDGHECSSINIICLPFRRK
jgi:hypothetical protein